MARTKLIEIKTICSHYHIDASFVQDLISEGVLEAVYEKEDLCIPVEKLPHLEKMMRIHQELCINVEGIDVVLNLLDRIETLHEELRVMKVRLNRYE